MTSENHSLRAEIVGDLMRPKAKISPKFFYDNEGSALFDQITKLSEYYPTRTEKAILERFAGELVQQVGCDVTLIEPGAGNCEKAQRLCELLQPQRFVAMDISADFLDEAAARMQKALPHLSIQTVVGDLTREIRLPSDLPKKRRLIFYPGSSIGNFDPPDAVEVLTKMKTLLDQDGSLLIGVDLCKPVEVLEAAYNDAEGVTAAFNLNVLNHLNRLIGSDFNLAEWRHRALFNDAHSRIEMHLEAKKAVVVRWNGGERSFAGGERIHTENSYKFKIETFTGILERSGFQKTQVWTDDRKWFALFLARPVEAVRGIA